MEDGYRTSLIPAFERHWQSANGREVAVEASFGPSGSQTRAVLGGFPADVVALSLVDHVAVIESEGLIAHDWRVAPWEGIITQSFVAIGVRPGNPLTITSWEDLASKQIGIVHADPRTSGAAMWCVAAVYGAGLLGPAGDGGDGDSTTARDLLADVERRVITMESSSRRALATFGRGIGDAVIDYESAILDAAHRGQPIELVLPEATILVENPIALVDRNVELHQNREVAEAFIEFLRGEEAQHLLAEHGFRPMLPSIRRAHDTAHPTPARAFDIEALGGWAVVRPQLFGASGLWSSIRQQLASEWE